MSDIYHFTFLLYISLQPIFIFNVIFYLTNMQMRGLNAPCESLELPLKSSINYRYVCMYIQYMYVL